MWHWTLNWSEIRHDIVVGSCPMRPHHVDRIADDAGVDALLSLQTDGCRAALGIEASALALHATKRGLVVVNVPMRDFDPAEQRRRLPEAVRALGALLSDGHRTYVHCTAGINRAPLVVLTYLTFVEGMATDEAIVLIHKARPEASPYWDAYHGCRDDALVAHATTLGHDDLVAEAEVLRRTFSSS